MVRLRLFAEGTTDKRSIPFIQLHEFEGYLFSDVSQFTKFFDNADSQISTLRKMTGNYSPPLRHSCASPRSSPANAGIQSISHSPQATLYNVSLWDNVFHWIPAFANDEEGVSSYDDRWLTVPRIDRRRTTYGPIKENPIRMNRPGFA